MSKMLRNANFIDQHVSKLMLMKRHINEMLNKHRVGNYNPLPSGVEWSDENALQRKIKDAYLAVVDSDDHVSRSKWDKVDVKVGHWLSDVYSAGAVPNSTEAYPDIAVHVLLTDRKLTPLGLNARLPEMLPVTELSAGNALFKYKEVISQMRKTMLKDMPVCEHIWVVSEAEHLNVFTEDLILQANTLKYRCLFFSLDDLQINPFECIYCPKYTVVKHTEYVGISTANMPLVQKNPRLLRNQGLFFQSELPVKWMNLTENTVVLCKRLIPYPNADTVDVYRCVRELMGAQFNAKYVQQKLEMQLTENTNAPDNLEVPAAEEIEDAVYSTEEENENNEDGQEDEEEETESEDDEESDDFIVNNTAEPAKNQRQKLVAKTWFDSSAKVSSGKRPRLGPQ